jgi:hypothetical protein
VLFLISQSWLRLDSEAGSFTAGVLVATAQSLSLTTVCGRSRPLAVSVCHLRLSSLYSMVSVWPGSSCSSAAACAQNKTLAGNSRKGSRGLHSLEIEIRARRFEGLSRGFGNAGDLQHHRDPEAALQETPAERPLTRLEHRMAFCDRDSVISSMLRKRLRNRRSTAMSRAGPPTHRWNSRGQLPRRNEERWHAYSDRKRLPWTEADTQ